MVKRYEITGLLLEIDVLNWLMVLWIVGEI